MHLNKPDTLNSLTVDMAGDFSAALQQLQHDSNARALIITGELFHLCWHLSRHIISGQCAAGKLCFRERLTLHTRTWHVSTVGVAA